MATQRQPKDTAMISRTESLAHRKTWLSPLLRSVLRCLRDIWVRAAQRRQLAQLSREQLADFAATPADQLAELDKPFWRD